MLRRIGKTKKTIAKMLAILGIVCVGFGVSYGFIKSNAPEPIVIQETKDLKVEVKEIKVEEVKSALQKVMVHEVNMSEIHTYKSDGWFTKDIKAKYYFDVMFSLDFTNMKDSQILIEGNHVRIYCTGLDVDVVCLENNTRFTEEGNTWYKFKDLKVDLPTQNDVIKELKEVIKDKAIREEEEYALTSAKKGIEKLLYKFDTNISVEIVTTGNR